TVIRIVAGNSRGHRNLHHNSTDSDAWAARVQSAYDAMDHGDAFPMPDSARSAAPASPGKSKKARAKAAKAATKHKKASKPKAAKAKRVAPKSSGKSSKRR